MVGFWPVQEVTSTAYNKMSAMYSYVRVYTYEKPHDIFYVQSEKQKIDEQNFE